MIGDYTSQLYMYIYTEHNNTHPKRIKIIHMHSVKLSPAPLCDIIVCSGNVRVTL